jgi:AraC-like DNA-binding protein
MQHFRAEKDISIQAIAYDPQLSHWRTEAIRSKKTAQLLRINTGHGDITIAGLKRNYGPHHLIFIPAGVMHGMTVHPGVTGQVLTLPDYYISSWPDTPQHIRLRDAASQIEASGLYEKISHGMQSEDRHFRALPHYIGLLCVFLECQLDLITTLEEPEIGENSSTRIVAAYTDLIERDYRSHNSVAYFAAQLGVTPTHLTRCCNQSCGKTALALLRERIHSEACYLLRETRKPIQNIAQSLGFASAAYFTRSFRAASGYTPSEFRRKGSFVAPVWG